MVHGEIFLSDYQYAPWKLIFLYKIEMRTETMIYSFISKYKILRNYFNNAKIWELILKH